MGEYDKSTPFELLKKLARLTGATLLEVIYNNEIL